MAFASHTTSTPAHTSFTSCFDNNTTYTMYDAVTCVEKFSHVNTRNIFDMFSYAEHISGAALNMYVFLVNTLSDGDNTFPHDVIVGALAMCEHTTSMAHALTQNENNNTREYAMTMCVVILWTTHGVSWDDAVECVNAIYAENEDDYRVTVREKIYAYFLDIHRTPCGEHEHNIHAMKNHIFNHGAMLLKSPQISSPVYKTPCFIWSMPIREKSAEFPEAMTLSEITKAIVSIPPEDAESLISTAYYSSFSSNELSAFDMASQDKHGPIVFHLKLSRILRQYHVLHQHTRNMEEVTKIYDNPTVREKWERRIEEKITHSELIGRMTFLRAKAVAFYYIMSLPLECDSDDLTVVDSVVDSIVSGVVRIARRNENEQWRRITTHTSMMFQCIFLSLENTAHPHQRHKLFPEPMMLALWEHACTTSDPRAAMTQMYSQVADNGVLNYFETTSLLFIAENSADFAALPREWVSEIISASCSS